MNLSTRLTKLESVTNASTTEHTGKPVRPLDMSDQQYLNAIKNKRIELGLKPSEPIPILALC
jgi:phosphate starvation-inducible protein PhoH